MENYNLDDEHKAVLAAIAGASDPVGTKDVVENSGLSKSKVAAKIKQLREKGLVDSPVRCKYAATDEGKKYSK